MEAEIYMDLSLKHYPLRDYRSMWNEMNSIVRDYDKLGKRNKHAIEHAKLSKHMMHLVRLYLMAFDILEKRRNPHVPQTGSSISDGNPQRKISR